MAEALQKHMAERAEQREAMEELFEGGRLWQSLLGGSSDEDDGDAEEVDAGVKVADAEADGARGTTLSAPDGSAK